MNHRQDLPQHPRLGRHINHDDRSRTYAVTPTADTLTAVRHPQNIAILNQKIGSCTGNAALTTVYHQPYATNYTRWRNYPRNQASAVKIYSQATQLDPFRGTYPPTDTGSDGLSVAKVLKNAGIITAYLWAFSPAQALAQLQQTPMLTGISWYESMFTPDATGLMTVDRTTGLAGGHELCVDEYIPATTEQPDKVGGPNSWGTGWGNQGRWYLTVNDWAALLAEDGDATALIR